MRKFFLALAMLGAGCSGNDIRIEEPKTLEHSVAESSVVEDFRSMISYYENNKSPVIDGNPNLQDEGFVLDLQKALFFHRYLDKTPDGHLDEKVISAVENYRRRNALAGHGIDKAFLKHISTPSDVRVKLLKESLSFVEGFDFRNSVYVNVPEFRMRYYFDGNLELSMNVIVGNGKLKPSRSGKWVTAVQKGTIENVIINPLWTATSIDLVEDTREDLMKSRSFREHMEQYIDGRWVPVGDDVIGTKFRQMPGPWSLQGRVNFYFSSEYGESLHGTPYKHLFSSNARNFSHGCMRMEDEIALFKEFQRLGVIDGTEDIDALIQADKYGHFKTRKVKLSDPVNVYVVYLRSWVDGPVMIMPPDVYGYKKSRVP